VEGRDSRAVRSFWGADRDGGARSHQGIDIFAPRGTPVLAAAGGVAWAGDNRLGGRVVFVRDPRRGVSHYYAHLDSQAVRSGALVRAGDTVGFVGNTGNARTTAPHLHFGVYAAGQGAIDPLPFVDTRRAPLPPLGRDTAWVRRLARTREARVAVRAGPSERAAPLRDVERHTALAVDGAVAGWVRVRLPDQSEGWVRVAALERADAPLRRDRLASAAVVRARPAPDAAAVRTVAAPIDAPVLGRFAGYVLVELEGGTRGWVAAD
jgi:SH3-like domain-containing protein